MSSTILGRLRLSFALSLSVLLFHDPVKAQSAAAEQTLELSARDKKGNPVLDLAASDVQIIEANQPVPVKSLRLMQQRQVPPIVTFVFDEVVSGVAKVHGDLAEEYLKEASGRGAVFTVLRVEGRLHLLQAPTTDIEAVRKAVVVATMGSTKEFRRATDAAEQQMEEDARNGSGARQMTAQIVKAMLLDSQQVVRTDGRATAPVAALLAACRGQAIWPGRKFLIYFSQGLHYHIGSPEYLRDIARAANGAQVSLYAMDAEIGDARQAHGMAAASAVGTAAAMGNLTAGMTDPAGTATVAEEFAGRMTAGQDAPIPPNLEALCSRTGGAHIYALGGDSRTRARGIAADLNSYYLVSWIPAAAGDRDPRPLRVQVSRKGVVLQTRSAARTGEQDRNSAAEDRLIGALAAASLPADLRFNSTLLRFGNTPDNDVNSIVLQVPPDATAASTVSVLAQLKDQSGTVVRKFSADILRRQPQQVIEFRRQFSAPPGEYVLETAAMDNRAKIGAARAKVVIPAISNGLVLGDVVLIREIIPGAGDPADPLRCAEGTVVPNLSARVSKAESPKMRLFFDLHPDPKSSEVPSLAAEIRRNGVLVASVPLKLSLDPKRPTTPYMFTLGTATLPAGQYQTAVILTQGSQRVSQSASFTLE